MIGRTYTERGQPVVVLTRWGTGGGPRNVLIRREDGTVVVRPFRGLRKPPGRGAFPHHGKLPSNTAVNYP
jgi:hypothetical protein